ncbi:hypothetical protein [Burkholderia arboris]|nr:hypothetical protein [Burkholderia arboris]
MNSDEPINIKETDLIGRDDVAVQRADAYAMARLDVRIPAPMFA